MTKLFLSFKFDDNLSKTIATQVRDELKRYGVEGIIAGDLTSVPPPDTVRSLIMSSNGLLAIITSTQADWIHNEIGMAYAAYLKIWGLVEEGVMVGGILPRITSYLRFKPTIQPFELKRTVANIASELQKSSGIQAVVDQTEMLTGWSGRLQIAIRPRALPSGDDIITVYIPPEFQISLLSESSETAAMTALGLQVAHTTEIPSTVCSVFRTIASKDDAFPGFIRLQITLTFPEVTSHLSAGWAEFQLNYTAPATAGTYRFYGTEQVSIVGSNPQNASPFEFEPIFVKGEVSPAALSGTLYTSPNVPLKTSGIVSAEMTMRIDPYSGKECPDLPKVNAKCYISARDEGKYKITGVAPGICDVYAAAIPFSRSLIRSGLKILAQPESVDGQVHLTVTIADNAAMAIQSKQINDYINSQARKQPTPPYDK